MAGQLWSVATLIAAWIDYHDEVERDFVILGDMNIEDAGELAEVTPHGFVSLNNECQPTNTNVSGPKPYDHVMVNRAFTTEATWISGLQVIDLVVSAAVALLSEFGFQLATPRLQFTYCSRTGNRKSPAVNCSDE